jgi:MobA/MobL family
MAYCDRGCRSGADPAGGTWGHPGAIIAAIVEKRIAAKKNPCGEVFSRGYGHSAVHAAAYRARDDLTDERTGLRHDYSRKAEELLFAGIYAPKDAPEWAHDRAQLWNHVEAFEKHRRAELAREFNIALLCELTLEQNRYALQDWIRDNFTRKGLIADAVIHAPSEQGDERNMHAHVMVVMRKLDGSEFARTKERFDTFSEKEAAKVAELEALRESWARTGNRHLERHSFEASLDHRTLEAQGVTRDPTIHMGKSPRKTNARSSTSRPSGRSGKHRRRPGARSTTSGHKMRIVTRQPKRPARNFTGNTSPVTTRRNPLRRPHRRGRPRRHHRHPDKRTPTPRRASARRRKCFGKQDRQRKRRA